MTKFIVLLKLIGIQFRLISKSGINRWHYKATLLNFAGPELSDTKFNPHKS